MQNSILNIFIFSVLSINSLSFRQPDYREVFGADWNRAMLFVSENRKWMKPELDRFEISFPVAVAVIFPELVRYSALQDKIEITLLKALYINLGAEYANFSIGRMQMKPSFAEKIHENAGDALGSESRKLFRIRSDFADIKDYRASIVSDLENPERQLVYLIAFLKICEKKFNMNPKDDTGRVRFLASAYNYGFWKSESEIEKMENKKFFGTTILKTETYSYADISLFYYKNYLTFH
jgi:hypothetical protein